MNNCTTDKTTDQWNGSNVNTSKVNESNVNTSNANASNETASNRNESYLILPFHYHGTMISIIKYLNAQEFKRKKESRDYTWIRDTKRVYRYLASHMNSLIDNDQPDSICLSYHLNPRQYSQFGLPRCGTSIKLISSILQGTNQKETFQFIFNNISLYLFKTGIGFIVLNIRHEMEESVNSIANKMFALTRFYTKEKDEVDLCNNQVQLQYSIQDTAPASVIQFSLTKAVNQLLHINGHQTNKITLFPTSNKKECNVFHRIFVPEVMEDEELKAKLFVLRRGFHSSFYTNDTDATVDSITDFTYQTQHNNYFSFCQKGLVCLYYPQVNREVFLNHFKNNVNVDYFFIYLFLLHERQALFYYNHIILLSRKNSNKLIHMKKLLINFRINYAYKVISDESSYQNYYNLLYQAFGLEALNSDIQDIIDRATEHQKNIHENSTNTALAILALFGVFSAFDSSFAVVDRFCSEVPLNNFHYTSILIILIMIFISIIFFIWIKLKK